MLVLAYASSEHDCNYNCNFWASCAFFGKTALRVARLISNHTTFLVQFLIFLIFTFLIFQRLLTKLEGSIFWKNIDEMSSCNCC